MSIKYNLENDIAVQALLNKQRDLIQEQAELLSRQDTIIGSLCAMLENSQHYGFRKMQIARLCGTVDHLEDKLTAMPEV